MKRRRLLFSFLCVCLVYSCAWAQEPTKSAQRIVSLAPSITEILFAVGAGDQVQGVTRYCEFPPEAKSKPKVGGFTEHSLEVIAAQRPDLVIVSPNGGSKLTYQQLNELGIETAVASFYSVRELLDATELIGRKSGHEKEAAALVHQFDSVIANIHTSAAGSKRPNVAFVLWHSPLIVASDRTLEGDIVRLSGANNIASSAQTRYPRLNAEALFKNSPDFIIDASIHETTISVEERRKIIREFWQKTPALDAVKNNRIVMFRQGIYTIPGPRTIRLIQAMDALLHQPINSTSEFYEQVAIA